MCLVFKSSMELGNAHGNTHIILQWECPNCLRGFSRPGPQMVSELTKKKNSC